MSGTITGTKLAKDILAGVYNAGALETLLTTQADLYLGPFKALVKSGSMSAFVANTDAYNAVTGSATALRYCMESPVLREAVLADPTARTTLTQTSEALAYILNTETLRLEFLKDSAFVTALQAAVHNGSYLYRETLTSTGNYTPHMDGVAAMYVVAVGRGGQGATANNNYGGQGGSGGEIAGGYIPVSDIPTTPVACTLPTSAGTPTTFGSLVSADSGVNGARAYTMVTGGGSTTGGGAVTGLTNNTLDSAAFHIYDFTEQGGDGGRSGADPDIPATTQAGLPGEAGLIGSGGTAGVNASAAGGAGSGISSGGGGGFATDVGTGIRDGGNAINPGCGGGGGNSNDGDGSYGAGGDGGTAKIWIYTVRKKV